MAVAISSICTEKTCKRCGEAKSSEAFGQVARRIGGRDHTCKACRNASRSPEARARSNAASKAWKKREPERFRETKRESEERRRRRKGMRPISEVLADHTERRETARNVAARRKQEIAQARILANPWFDPTLSRAEKFALRYKLDPEFNLKQRLRAAERRRQRGLNIGDYIRPALCSNGKSKVVFRELGYTIQELRRHLERQFHSGMNWQRFAAGEIHIDHRRPLSAFDLSDHDEWRRAWALTNLQPLWASENLAKGAKRGLLL